MKVGELKTVLENVSNDADVKVIYKDDNGISNTTDKVSLYKNLIGNELEIRGSK